MNRSIAAGVLAGLLLAACGGASTDQATAPASTAAPQHGARLYAATVSNQVATFSGNRGNYTITRTTTGYTVADNVGVDGTQTFSASTVKVLKFADIAINLDIINKAAALSTADLSTLIELYIAYFNRVPDAEGLSYWIDQRAAGASFEDIGKTFYAAAVANAAVTGYSANASNEDFVRTVYANVLARTNPDAGGLAYWTDSLNKGTETRGTLVKTMLASAHTFNGDATYGWIYDLLINKIAVAYEHTVQQGITYNDGTTAITTGKSIAAAVTATDTTAALNAVDALQTDKRATVGTVVTGIVSVGNPVTDATVSAYKVVGGAKSSFIASTKTDVNGQYTLNLGSYTGPFLIEVSSGTYKDPVTSSFGSVSSMRAVVAQGSGSVKVNVSPYTEVIVANASSATGGLTTTNINIWITNVIKVIGFDPTNTKPVNPKDKSSNFATSKSLDYGVVLGTASQYKAENKITSMTQTMSDLAQMLSSVQPLNANALLQQAATDYMVTVNETFGAAKLCIPDVPDPNALYTVRVPCKPTGTKSPVVSCDSPYTYSNGLCILPDGAVVLSKTWTGTWSWAGPAPTCSSLTLNDGGSITLNITQSGTSFSGTGTGAGIQIYTNCAVTQTKTETAKISGTISGNLLKWTLTFTDPSLGDLVLTGTGTVSNGKISGALTRSVGGSGTLQLQ